MFVARLWLNSGGILYAKQKPVVRNTTDIHRPTPRVTEVMSTANRDRTPGTLTTEKVQALLDSGLNPAVRCRRSLAMAMTDAGDKISVHGVEGWFKHVDSNYSLERESLHPEHRSYPVPKRRWVAILTLFDLEPENLELGDGGFRDFCFKLKKRSPAAAPTREQPGAPPLVFVLYAQRDGEQLYEEFLWLREQGINLWWDTSPREGSEWSDAVSTVIERAQLCLLYSSLALNESERCMRELQLVRDLGLELLVVKADRAALPATLRGVKKRYPTFLRSHPGYSSDVLHVLSGALGVTGGEAIAEPTPDFELSTVRPDFDRPSIAVLPFANLAGTPEFTYISQGITEDLITLLARMPELLVSSRMASNAFNGMLVEYQQLRKSLGVRYIVEGSVRAIADQVRINVNLTDLVTGKQLWAQRFDGLFHDLYEAQDEITAAIRDQLKLQGVRAPLDYGSRTTSMETWRYCHLGWYKTFVEPHMPGLQEALDCFYNALEHEPDYAPAHAGIVMALGTGMIWGGIAPDKFGTAISHAQRAYELLPENPTVLWSMGMIEFISPNPIENTLHWVDQAVALEPSNAAYLAAQAYLLAQTGRHEEGLELCKKVHLLSAGDMRQPFINYMVSNVHICAGQFEQGVKTMLLSDKLQSIDFVWFMSGFCRFSLGQVDEAAAALGRMLDLAHRSYHFFEYSIHQRLWPQHSAEHKDAYLSFCAEQGLL